MVIGSAVLLITDIVNDIIIDNNIFVSNNVSDEFYGDIILHSNNSLTLNNCSFIDNNNNNIASCFEIELQNTVTFKNCLFSNNTSLFNLSQSRYYLQYCDIFESGNAYSETNLSNCIFENPLIDENYQPIWTSTQKSPLIDVGDPTILDPDNTYSDIGAVRAIEHKQFILQLPAYNQDNGIKWTCFPVLDRLCTVYSRADSLLGNLLTLDEEDTPLYEVQYKPGGEEQQSIGFNNHHWTNTQHQFTSPQGYKFIMKTTPSENPNGYLLTTSGSLAPNTTPINLYRGYDNWIGYFLTESQKMENAFGSEVMPHITSVKTQHWFWMKTEPANGDTTSIIKCNYTLNYGDMLIVSCDEDITFQWQNGTPMEPIMKTNGKIAKFSPIFTIESMKNFLYFIIPKAIKTNNPILRGFSFTLKHPFSKYKTYKGIRK